MKKAILVIVLVLTPAAAPALADCVPHKVLKIVTAAEYPGKAADDFVSQPRTFYRLEDRFGRIEEPLNPKDNVHLTVIISEPDVWMINLADMTGQHVVDPGPTFEFHAPVLDAVESRFWRQFEFGCEVPFMKAAGAQVDEAGENTTRYSLSREDATVILTVVSGKPARVEIQKSGSNFAIRYLTYEMLPDASADLFKKPENVRFAEATAKE
jgi:hypothetical protein